MFLQSDQLNIGSTKDFYVLRQKKTFGELNGDPRFPYQTRLFDSVHEHLAVNQICMAFVPMLCLSLDSTSC